MKNTITVKRRMLVAFVGCAMAALAALGLAGCSSQQSNDELTVAWTSNMGDYSLDPTNNYMGWQGSYLNIYEQLFQIDGNFKAQPLLAESAEQVDGTTWKIKIRDGITFQNGDALDAAAVKASLERAAKESPRAAKALDAQSIEAEGQTLTIKTNTENMGYLNELCEPVFSIIDVAATEDFDKPIGTGAYQMDEVDNNGNVKLSAYDGYWQGEPKVKSVNAQYITDDKSKVNAMQTGEIQATMNIAADQIDNFSDTSQYTTYQTNQGRAHMLYFNMASGASTDPAVREAVASCIDRDGFLNSIYKGAADKTQGVFPDASGYSEGIAAPAFDTAHAKQVLADAGYADTDGDGYVDKDGKKLSLTFVTYEANAALPQICEAMSSTLKDVGIEVNVEVAEKIGDRLQQGNWDVATMAYNTLPTGDPYTKLYDVMSTNGSSNYGHYSNAQVDSLIDELKVTSDADKRTEIVKQIQQIALGDNAYAYIVHALSTDVTDADVKNLQMHGQYDWLNYQVEVDK